MEKAYRVVTNKNEKRVSHILAFHHQLQNYSSSKTSHTTWQLNFVYKIYSLMKTQLRNIVN